MIRVFVLIVSIALALSAQTTKAPKIWDDQALEDWATPIAAIGVRPGHFTSEEYYAAPADNTKTYPVYRPDREPACGSKPTAAYRGRGGSSLPEVYS